MSTDEAIRASDADREHAVGMLRDGYATGRLTLAEFDERTTAALTSRTWGELRRLTGDLPAPGQRVLPPPAPRQALGGTERLPAAALADRGPGLTPILLIAVYWLTLTFTAHAAGLLIPVVFLLLMVVQTAGRVRCGLDSAAHRPPGQSRPSQRSEEGPSRPG
jgi:Domain of unknown function (DUF1707)